MMFIAERARGRGGGAPCGRLLGTLHEAVEAVSRRGSGLMPAGPRAGPVLASTSMS